MAKIFGIFGLAQRGQYAKVIVYYRMRGQTYARHWVRGTNPRTPAQRNVRNYFASAVRAYQAISWPERLAWRKAAYNTNMSGYELFLSTYVKANYTPL